MDDKVVITVLGKDKTGIVSEVSTILRELNINILDISQTIFEDDIFSMVMLVNSSKEIDMNNLQNKLSIIEEKMELKIFAQHENIFNAMHKI